MYAQLGNIVFDGAKSFTSYDSSTEESYAVQDRINRKPLIQHTGTGLEQISLSIRFHIAFCNPAQEVEALRNLKEIGEVLPYILGNGYYRGDYVITSLSESQDFTDSDGTVLSCVVNITLLEYQTDDKVYRAKLAARKAAFATSGKQMVTVPRVQPPTATQLCAIEIGKVNQYGVKIDENVSQYIDNVSKRGLLSSSIFSSLNGMENSIEQVTRFVSDSEHEILYKAVFDACNSIKASISRFEFPISDTDVLKRSNRDLQALIRNFRRVCGQLLNNVIIRAV